MKKKIMTAITIATACTLALTLAGCSKTNNDKSADDPIPVTQAFHQKSVWVQYNKDEQIGKDVDIKRVLAFDGKGHVTVYDTDYIWMNGGSSYQSLTFRDLNGLSDNEIIKLAKQKNRERFDATKQSAIDETNETIEASTQSNDPYTVNATEGQKVNEAATYQQPKAVSFTLTVKTDDTGNNTQSETLSFEYTSLNSAYFYSGSNIGSSPDRYADEELYETDQEKIELWSSNYSTTSIVYDTTFAGFAGLATIVNEGHAGFTWDSPDSKGIEVD